MTKSKGRSRAKSGVPLAQEAIEDVWQRNPETVRRFIDLRRDHEQLCAEVEYILRKRLGNASIEISTVISRAKTLSSFLGKLQRKKYSNPFEQITDLAGARVVCLYLTDVEKIAEIIRSEFEVIEEMDKANDLGVDHFGYGARHFLVRLGKSTSGARYDDLKHLISEIQVRTVVQDAWAILQHHLVYKRESEVPTKVQRKLNSLAGLFETVDDQFESIRRERDSYIAKVRETIETPAKFLRNELNLDSFKEYLATTYPERPVEKYEGQANVALGVLLMAGLKSLQDLDTLLKDTAEPRKKLMAAAAKDSWKVNGQLPSDIESVLAVVLTNEHWQQWINFGEDTELVKKTRQLLVRDGKKCSVKD